MGVVVGVVGVFGDGAFEGEALRGFHVVEVGGHGAVGVFLNDEVNVSALV